MNAHPFDNRYPRRSGIDLTLGGQPVALLESQGGPVALATVDGPVEAVWERPQGWATAVVRPHRIGSHARIEGNRLIIPLQGPARLMVDVGLGEYYFLFLNSPEMDRPPADFNPHRRYEAGRLHEVGVVDLQAGERVWIEAGAIVRGLFHASDADDVRIAGPGVIDGQLTETINKRKSPIFFDRCQRSVLEGVTILNPQTWCCVLCDCTQPIVRGINILSHGGGRDGVDLVSCRQSLVEDCLIRSGDDSIVFKAFKMGARESRADDIQGGLVRRCCLLKDPTGSTMEIGHELRCQTISDIRWEDCDILGAHGHGAVFSINNAECARVENIHYENIRVEHYFSRLIDFRVIQSRYSRLPERGHIRRVSLRDIAVRQSPFNAGYSISLIGGWDEQHRVEDVVLENIAFDGQRITRSDQLDLFTKQAGGIVIR